MYKDVELRKLPMGTLCTIAAILETDNDWKKVMALIPRNPRSDYFEAKYNSEHIKQIEDAARQSNRKCAEILFDEWGTSGRIRPTLSTLKDVVQKAEIYRAADEIAHMLKESPQRPDDGPGVPIDTNITRLMMEMHGQLNNGTTAQMRSLNGNPEPKSLGNKTTAQIQSNEGQHIIYSDSYLPDFSALGIETTDQNSNVHQITFPNIEISLTNSVHNNGIATEILSDEKLAHFQYKELEKVTKRFAERLMYTPDPSLATEEGQVQGRLAGKIGSGGFGDVYVGWIQKYGHIAIKRARQTTHDRKPDISMRVFNSEVKYLSQFRHKNIVPIIGFSMDGPALCIVCEYIDGGSLEQKLAAKILTKKQRLNILLGTAEGLKYLHASEKPMIEEDQNPIYKTIDSDPNSKKNFVHGDVKTANILLTRDCVPKLCDFGLAKQYESTFITTCPMGTSAYMAPEGFNGTITQKIDVYSFGIVMLEVLTGLRPLVACNGERINIKEYVEECCPTLEITHLLDPFIAKWAKAKDLFALSKQCLQRDRKVRPTSADIVERLCQIRDNDGTDAGKV